MSADVWAVAVHVGAGHHSRANFSKYNNLCKKACEKAKEILLSEGGSADRAVSEAIKILEDDPITNSGYGSNLTLDGEVECDASLMISHLNSDQQYGGIGAASGIKNPIEMALHLAKLDKPGGLLPGKRVTPLLLTGHGAKRLIERDYPSLIKEFIVDSKSLISAAASSRHIKYCKAIGIPTDLDQLQDTVGAVCIDLKGVTAAGVSSGGLLLKFPGRVGEAGVYGAGCWAQQEMLEGRQIALACSTTGTGEAIIQTEFSKSLLTEILRNFSSAHGSNNDPIYVFAKSMNSFLSDPVIVKRYPPEHQGVGSIMLISQQNLVAKHDSSVKVKKETTLELVFGHTTQSMGLGYYSNQMSQPKFFMSRKNHPNQSYVVSGVPL